MHPDQQYDFNDEDGTSHIDVVAARRKLRLANIDKDLCLTCGALVQSDLGGGPCQDGHITVHQVMCAGECGQILGVRTLSYAPEAVYCPVCMDKVKGVSVSPETIQAVGRKVVLAHPKQDLYVLGIRGDLYLSWCSAQDVHFALRFPEEQAEELVAKYSEMAGCQLTYEVVGVDVLI